MERKTDVIGTNLDQFVALDATTPSVSRVLNNFGGKIMTHEEAGLRIIW